MVGPLRNGPNGSRLSHGEHAIEELLQEMLPQTSLHEAPCSIKHRCHGEHPQHELKGNATKQP